MYSVYFIQQVIKGKKGMKPVKIGFSKDPESRIKSLQTASPYILKVVINLPFETKREAEIVEHCMHRLGKVKHKRLCGEWFLIYGSWPNFISESLKMAEHPIAQSLS